MKSLSTVLILFILSSFALAQNKSAYDSTLAKSYGADDYGMKSYTLVILKTGAATIENKNVRDSLFRGHMANIEYLVSIDQLILAGPLQQNEK